MTFPSPEDFVLSPASLYVHVPFCASKCAYCDFFSVPKPADALVAAVLSSVGAEVAAFARHSGIASFDTAYIGGGTPTSVGPNALSRLLRSLVPFLGSAREVTVEANPESLDAETLSVLLDFPVTRISLGVQSMSREALATARRPGDLAAVHRALTLLASRWTSAGRDLSLDFIAGLPDDSPTAPKAAVKAALDSGAGHVSVYSLTVEEGTPFASLDSIPGEVESEASFFAFDAALREAGFARYEISNYAMPGRECLHNGRYWDMESWFGAGPRAVSWFPGKAEGAIRISGGGNLDSWVPRETEAISPRDDAFERIMMGLRASRGVDVAALERRYRGGFREAILASGGGLVRPLGDRIAPTEEGMNLLNRILLPLMDRVDALFKDGRSTP